MTNITFFCGEREVFHGFVVTGHSEFAPEGEDIVCAAVTSAIRYLVTTVKLTHENAPLAVRLEEGYLSWLLPSHCHSQVLAFCQPLLLGLCRYFSDLSKEYPDNLAVPPFKALDEFPSYGILQDLSYESTN